MNKLSVDSAIFKTAALIYEKKNVNFQLITLKLTCESLHVIY